MKYTVKSKMTGKVLEVEAVTEKAAIEQAAFMMFGSKSVHKSMLYHFEVTEIRDTERQKFSETNSRTS